MRDVNWNEVAWHAGKTAKFYLNYEGCKLVRTVFNNVTLPEFYLNYEGCKRISNTLKVKKYRCFI